MMKLCCNIYQVLILLLCGYYNASKLSCVVGAAASTGFSDERVHARKRSSQADEAYRCKEYKNRNYTWPIPKYTPDTIGWKTLIDGRFEQIQQIRDNSNARYSGYLQTIKASLLVQNYTEYGFGLSRAPEALTKELQEAIDEGLRTGKVTKEKKPNIIQGKPANFIDRPDLTKKVLRELQPYVEAWSGINVEPQIAYGFRLYQNESSLYMHTDKIQTHILSIIFHIDSSNDSKPWPIYIEDFKDGNTYEVILTPGDMLFYESAKCFHGRPKKFDGSWYTSIFVHYSPVGWANNKNIDYNLENHFAVPPQWVNEPPSQSESKSVDHHHMPELQMVGSSMKEPTCPNQWCRTENAIKWNVPGEEGSWIAPNFNKYNLDITTSTDRRASVLPYSDDL